MNESESKTLNPKSWNGKTLTLLGEICSSWGYSGKKAAIVKIAEHLCKEGFEVKYIIQKIPGVTGIVRLKLEKDDGTQEIVFSNDKKDLDKGAIFGYSISSKEKEIFAKLESL